MDWHPISLAVQTGPNEWALRNPRSTDFALGRIHRIEFGLYREVWFRAAVLVDDNPKILGYSRTAEEAAAAIWKHGRADSHTKPHAGYPTPVAGMERQRTPPRAARSELRKRA